MILGKSQKLNNLVNLFVSHLAKIADNIVSEKTQAPSGRDFRIKLTDSAGRGISRISESFLAIFFLFFIEFGKIFFAK